MPCQLKVKDNCIGYDDGNNFEVLTNFSFEPVRQVQTGKTMLPKCIAKATPTSNLTTVKELRWSLFKKKQAESDRLPPTQAALHQAILRAHFQLMVWNKDAVPNPVLPSPRDYCWVMENGEWVPVMTTLTPAPEAIIQLVKYRCSKERCKSNLCQCRRAGLLCTDLCSCSDDSECENQQNGDLYQSDMDESDDDESSDE
ncbi:hypothetical protein ACROYT_G015654 [Oculina patagonica]